MGVELMNTTEQLLRDINEYKLTQKEVAQNYALSICSIYETDWVEVNAAIVERWSMAGLVRIKNIAWNKIDRKVTYQIKPTT